MGFHRDTVTVLADVCHLPALLLGLKLGKAESTWKIRDTIEGNEICTNVPEPTRGSTIVHHVIHTLIELLGQCCEPGFSELGTIT